MKEIEYELEGFNNGGHNNLSWKESLKVLKDDDAVNFSVKVVKALEEKLEAHNESTHNKVTLKQLKKVYRRAAGNVFAEVGIDGPKGRIDKLHTFDGNVFTP